MFHSSVYCTLSIMPSVLACNNWMFEPSSPLRSSYAVPIGPLARFGGLLVPLRSHTLVLAHTHLRIMFGESTAALLRCARPSGFET